MTAVPISFEFFPPRGDDGLDQLVRVRDRLDAAGPEYYSVTYGAGGSTRDRTYETVLRLLESGADVAPHLSFGVDDDETVAALLDRYRGAGVKRIVALRGDAPSGTGGRPRYAAELVRFIRERYGDHFHIEVGCYPEYHPDSRSPEMDVRHFREKVEAGADVAITQYFYNTDAYFQYVDRARAAGVDVPIIPGVMPIINADNLVRFSAKCGAEIPRWLGYRIAELKDDKEGLLRFGVDEVSRICEVLIDGGAPGLHLYSMNQSRASLGILNNLGITA